MKETTMTVDPKRKAVIFKNTNSFEFVPKYLYYVLEYYQVPKNFKIIFKDNTYQDIIDFMQKGVQNGN